MKARIRRVAALAVGAACLIPASAVGGTTEVVTVADNSFDPETLPVDLGAPVHWGSLGPTVNDHTVMQDKGLFKTGASTSISFTRVPSAGTFPYYCRFHGDKGGRGMSGVLKVEPDVGSLKSARRGGAVFQIAWADGSDTGDQFDVQYKVGNHKWKYWKKNTSQVGGLFGASGKPVTVQKGKFYRVRARSEKSSNPRKRSGWSPAVGFGAIP